MKILHVIPSFGLGGMEKVICSVINHTSNRYQHTIVSLDGNDCAIKWINNDNIQRIKFYKDKNSSLYIKRLYTDIKNLSPDLLMTYNWGATDAIWIGRMAGIRKIIHHEHGFSIEEAQMTARKRDICRFIVYRMASVLVTVSSNLKISIRNKYRLSTRHVQVIPNGIDTDHYSPDFRSRLCVRKELNFDEEDFVIVFSGRLDPVKNFELLLDVFEYCHKADCRIKLLIVGDGPERQKIERISIQKNIHTSLVMVGQCFEVLPYLRVGDVFLLTSLTEQMPLAILEAMSVGLPVIASDVGEISNIVDDGKNGFLRNIHNGCAEFASAILSLKESSYRQTMSYAARSKILAGFQETMMVRRYQTLIDDLLAPYGQ